MAKKLILSESQFNRLIVNKILAESNIDDVIKSRELERKIKDETISAVKNDKELERELEKKIKKIVAKSVSELFKVLWQKRAFYENDF